MGGAVGSKKGELCRISYGVGAQAWILNWILQKNVNPEESTRGHPDYIGAKENCERLRVGHKDYWVM